MKYIPYALLGLLCGAALTWYIMDGLATRAQVQYDADSRARADSLEVRQDTIDAIYIRLTARDCTDAKLRRQYEQDLAARPTIYINQAQNAAHFDRVGPMAAIDSLDQEPIAR